MGGVAPSRRSATGGRVRASLRLLRCARHNQLPHSGRRILRQLTGTSTGRHTTGMPLAAVSRSSGAALWCSRKATVCSKLASPLESTSFAIGSATNAMTSAVLAMFADEGKHRWDDRVIDDIPELRLCDACTTREATIRDL